jgi:hypothetical protein
MKKLIIGGTAFVILAFGVCFFAINEDKDETNRVAPSDIKQIVQDISLGNNTCITTMQLA